MTDPPTPEELAAKLKRSTFLFQRAALNLSEADNASDPGSVEKAARAYVKRTHSLQWAVEEAHEAFKEPPADG